jgi:hypothetical protein
VEVSAVGAFTLSFGTWWFSRVERQTVR